VKRFHTDLDAWRGGIDLVKKVYEATDGFPSHELYGLTGQLRRAAVSVPANIAEGAARGSRKEFRHFLTIARGSLSELETLIVISEEVGYLVKEARTSLLKSCDTVSALLSGLITNLESRK